MKRVRPDLVRKKLALMRGKFVTVLAAVPTASLPWMPLWLGTQTKVTEMGLVDKVARRMWIFVTGGWKECTLEMADRAVRESAMIRKD